MQIKRIEGDKNIPSGYYYKIDNVWYSLENLYDKYNKALELLVDFNLPCEIDDFNLVNSDYCETHCGIDEEQFKKCWDKFIEWKLNKEE